MFSMQSCLPQVTDCHHLSWRYCDKNRHIFMLILPQEERAEGHDERGFAGRSGTPVISVFFSLTHEGELCSYKTPTHKTHSAVTWCHNRLWLKLCKLCSVQVCPFSDSSTQIVCPTLFKKIWIHSLFCLAQNIKEGGFVHSPVYWLAIPEYTDLLLLRIYYSLPVLLQGDI